MHLFGANQAQAQYTLNRAHRQRTEAHNAGMQAERDPPTPHAGLLALGPAKHAHPGEQTHS